MTRNSLGWAAGLLALVLALLQGGPSFTPPASAQVCSPRPNVGIVVTTVAPDRLQAVITAGSGTIQAVRFPAPQTTAIVTIQGQVQSQPSTYSPPGGTTQITLSLTRAPAGSGAAITVPLEITDACGIWPTFIGGGTGALDPTPTPTSTTPPTSTATATATLTGAIATNIPAPTPQPTPPPPADPAPAAPTPLSGAIPLQKDRLAFLYTGPAAVQTGLTSTTLNPAHTALVRGRVLDRSSQPMAGVTIAVLGYPEFGQTVSRADGKFDLVVNGGSQLTLTYLRTGFLTVHRIVDVPANAGITAPDVVLLPYDPAGSRFDLNAFQSGDGALVRGSVVTDSSGTRQATALFKAGTTASLMLSNGSTQPISQLTVRATEYSAGSTLGAALPATLPAAASLAYAAEITVDEAEAANATSVNFSQPVPIYVENFLGLPVGMEVPAASYDRRTGAWAPVPDGRVIKIVAINGGVADLDITGDNVADDASVLGVDLAERRRLGATYTVGTSLWRTPVTHFTAYAYAFVGVGGAKPSLPDLGTGHGSGSGGVSPPALPNLGVGEASRLDIPTSRRSFGAIIEPENQVLLVGIPISGTSASLVYASDRQPGRRAPTELTVPLVGGSIPPGLREVRLSISVAGQQVLQRYTSFTPDQSFSFNWNGLDAYGRPAAGRQQAMVTIEHDFNGTYFRQASLPGGPSFASNGATVNTGVSTRQPITFSATAAVTLGANDARGLGLGGWSFDIHHQYDAASRMLFLGDGKRLTLESLHTTLERLAGRTGIVLPPTQGGQWPIVNAFSGDGSAANQAALNQPHGAAVGPDGAVYIADTKNHRIRKIHPQTGAITTVAGGPGFGYRPSDEGGQAVGALLNAPQAVAVGHNGELYIADTGNALLRQVFAGRIDTIAGLGSTTVEGAPARSTQLNMPTGIAVGPDRWVYYVDTGYNRVRKFLPGGNMVTVAGNGQDGTIPPTFTDPNDKPAVQALLAHPRSVAVGKDGEVYIADTGRNRIRVVRKDGMIRAFAGTGEPSDPSHVTNGDDGPAVSATMLNPTGLAAAPDGSVYLIDEGMPGSDLCSDGSLGSTAPLCIYTDSVFNAVSGPIRRVSPFGTISTVAGNGFFAGLGPSHLGLAEPLRRSRPANPGSTGEAPLESTALRWRLNAPQGLAVGPDGSLVIVDTFHSNVLLLRDPLPGVDGATSAGDTVVPSTDGSSFFIFDSTGRHLRTVHAGTGLTLVNFTYGSDGKLTQMTDSYGQTTSIIYSGGQPTTIVSPLGEPTALATDANGYLNHIRNPANESVRPGYSSLGLLQSLQDPRGHTYTYGYEASGRLTSAAPPGGAAETLVRTDLGNGFRVTVTSPLGRTTEYESRRSTQGESRLITGPDGSETTIWTQTSELLQIDAPDGTQASITRRAHPRLGQLARFTEKVELRTPGNRTYERSTLIASIVNGASGVPLPDQEDVYTFDGSSGNADASQVTYLAGLRTYQFVTAEGRRSESQVNTRGQVTQSSIDGLASTNHLYDGRGRLTQTTTFGSPDRTTVYTYYADGDAVGRRGRLRTVADPEGHVTEYQYDQAGRVSQVNLPGGRVIQGAYDVNGNLTALLPPSRPAHQFGYDNRDRLTSITPPSVMTALLGGPTSMAYNNDDQLTDIALPGSRSVSLGYDSAGRPDTMDFGGRSITLSYGSNGHLDQVDGPDGTSDRYVFDGLLNLSSTSSGGGQGAQSMTYDYRFRTATQSLNGSGLALAYDRDNLPTQVGALTLTRETQKGGLLAQTRLGSSPFIGDTYGHSDFGELSSYSLGHNANSGVYGLSFTRDRLGRITARTETIDADGSGPDGSTAITWSYTYDAPGRLIEAKRNGVPYEQYGYDGNGARLSFTAGATHPLPSVSSAQVAVDDQDRLNTYGAATFTYTPDGFLATRQDGQGTTAYDYDELGNLRQVDLPNGDQITYVSDGWNRRVAKQLNGLTVRRWHFLDELRLDAELDPVNGSVLTRFIYGTGGTVPSHMEQGGQTYRLVTDQVGSVRLVLRLTDGAVLQRLSYDSFGVVLEDTNPGFQPFGFAGGLYDPDTGWLRFGARDYDAQVGRWTAKDPIGFDAGDTNLYAYTMNDPVNRRDPRGLSGEGPTEEERRTIRRFLNKLNDRIWKKHGSKSIANAKLEKGWKGVSEAPEHGLEERLADGYREQTAGSKSPAQPGTGRDQGQPIPSQRQVLDRYERSLNVSVRHNMGSRDVWIQHPDDYVTPALMGAAVGTVLFEAAVPAALGRVAAPALRLHTVP